MSEGLTGIAALEAEMRDRTASMGAEIDRLFAENERLREALTPSGETKAAYIGEFEFRLQDVNEPGGHRTVDVPWTTVKEIMASIRARAGVEEKP